MSTEQVTAQAVNGFKQWLEENKQGAVAVAAIHALTKVSCVFVQGREFRVHAGDFLPCAVFLGLAEKTDCARVRRMCVFFSEFVRLRKYSFERAFALRLAAGHYGNTALYADAFGNVFVLNAFTIFVRASTESRVWLSP